MNDLNEIKIKGEHITLGQLIKALNYISSGGETKVFLEKNTIMVNKEKENRRGKKLYKGDKIIIKDQEYIIC